MKLRKQNENVEIGIVTLLSQKIQEKYERSCIKMWITKSTKSGEEFFVISITRYSESKDLMMNLGVIHDFVEKNLQLLDVRCRVTGIARGKQYTIWQTPVLRKRKVKSSQFSFYKKLGGIEEFISPSYGGRIQAILRGSGSRAMNAQTRLPEFMSRNKNIRRLSSMLALVFVNRQQHC